MGTLTLESSVGALERQNQNLTGLIPLSSA